MNQPVPLMRWLYLDRSKMVMRKRGGHLYLRSSLLSDIRFIGSALVELLFEEAVLGAGDRTLHNKPDPTLTPEL